MATALSACGCSFIALLQRDDYVVVLNFGGWAGYQWPSELNLPPYEYRELWNSTWPAFAIEAEREGEHTNGGRDAWIHWGIMLQISDYGVVILQRR